MTVPTAPPRLVVEGLTVAAVGSGAAIIEDVSAEVAAGEVLGVVGESGRARPPSAWRCSATPDAGWRSPPGPCCSAAVTSSRRRRAAARLRGAAISYVPQDPASALNPALRIGLQLRGGARRARRPAAAARGRRAVAEMIARSRSPATASSCGVYPHQLSGGQQQRVAPRDGIRVPAAPDRPRRADHRARRHDAGARARDRRANVRGCTGSPRSTSATIWPSSASWPTGSRSCTRAGWSRQEQPRTCSAHRHTPTPRGCSGRSRHPSVLGA